MAITDLTGTTWTIGDTLTSYPMGTYSLKTYALNITTSEALPDTWGNTHDTFVQMLIGYESGNELNMVFFCADTSGYPRTVVATGNDTKTLPDTWNSHFKGTFTITGGADAQDLDLITWFEGNAEVPPSPDLTVSYAGSTILEMSASGTKTLKTAGKYCNSDILINYTKSGGGSVEILPGVLRADAELINTYKEDALVEADLGIEIPAYTTSAKTLRTGATLEATPADFNDYNYFIVEKFLTIPIYSDNVAVKGRQEYTASVALYEIFNITANSGKAISQDKYVTARNGATAAAGAINRELYWSSTTALAWYTATTYGAAQVVQAPSTSGGITPKAPNITLRGHTTYFTSAAWAKMTDIRIQNIIEIWRVPIEGVQGWQLTSGIQHILEDVTNGGTLT